jgi:succinate dehydrogenase/fumarate reductase cytochrome b subunit
VTALFRQFAFKAAAVVVVWAPAHHVLGGVRHLLGDFDIGSPLRVARS